MSHHRTGAARGRVRLRTLSNLRWLAIAGQSAALFLVYFALGYSLPLGLLRRRHRGQRRPECRAGAALSRQPPPRPIARRAIYLAFDVLQLAALLYLTGGITNPFALMFVAPVVIAAATLNLGNTLILAGIAFVSVSLIGVVHRPLPWPAGEALVLPQLYQAGIWAALVIGIGFTSVYAWRIASESARMSAGLAATQLALAREHRLASLGALATAAAHELGTPLGTIAVVARELERALPANSAEVEDVRLLRDQAERCRAIIARLANPEEAHAGRSGAAAAGRAAGRHRRAPSRRGSRHHGRWRRHSDADNPAAASLARAGTAARAGQHHRERRRLRRSRSARCRPAGTQHALTIVVEDDGPGFAPEIFEAHRRALRHLAPRPSCARARPISGRRRAGRA